MTLYDLDECLKCIELGHISEWLYMTWLSNNSGVGVSCVRVRFLAGDLGIL